MKLEIVPISFKDANAYVKEHHRHHSVVRGTKFCLAVSSGPHIRGVAMCGRPVSRVLDDGFTIEVNRLCTDGTKNACSMLYSASWRAARALGYRRCITYILASERGTSLLAAGWNCLGKVTGRQWDCPSRHRPPNKSEDKLKWQIL